MRFLTRKRCYFFEYSALHYSAVESGIALGALLSQPILGQIG